MEWGNQWRGRPDGGDGSSGAALVGPDSGGPRTSRERGLNGNDEIEGIKSY
jgi:hypothetical protein